MTRFELCQLAGIFQKSPINYLYSNAVLIGSFLHSVEGTSEENDTRGGTL
jgi:hypothetical protein